jgi:hypothetical protein
MIVVRVELHSAINGRVSEIGRIVIANDGTGSASVGNYRGLAYRGRSRSQLDRRVVTRTGIVRDYPRLRLHVWNLVAKMLASMGYGR